MIDASEYQHQYDNNKTCIKVRTDVVFTMTNWKEIITFDGSNFTVESGHCALSGDSAAEMTLATIKGDFLILVFLNDAQNQTSMNAQFHFTPYKYFPNIYAPCKYFLSRIQQCLISETYKYVVVFSMNDQRCVNEDVILLL